MALLFLVVRYMTSSANDLNNDLLTIANWAYQRKMSFNPDLPKQAQEVAFFSKLRNQTIQI